ncbi:hypothetical protein JOL62DRAFT_559391 [Phyllosticta paracitricarpa]|uniref:DUF676 domain-containing protein n=1 Tax=Phyllosticta paracitricarpa TaxID=2016321 RepID=A0ABR1N0I4_9PEZI
MVREPGYGPLHLWKPNDEDDIVADICFVHGLGGHREHTWTKDDEKVKSCWPRDFLGQDINNVRTFTWGYDAEVVKFFGGNSELNLENLGDSLLQGIARFRKDTPEDRPLILVGHSLGGIVIKQLFFATPHRGSQFANYGKVLAKITKVSLRRPNTSLLKLLQQGSMSLDAQRPAFNTAAGGIHIVCFYETIGKSWGFLDMKRIVDEESAKIEGREVKVIPINADHSNICKFGSRNEDNYKTAIYEFELVVKSIKKERELRAQNIQNQLNNQANEG